MRTNPASVHQVRLAGGARPLRPLPPRVPAGEAPPRAEQSNRNGLRRHRSVGADTPVGEPVGGTPLKATQRDEPILGAIDPKAGAEVRSLHEEVGITPPRWMLELFSPYTQALLRSSLLTDPDPKRMKDDLSGSRRTSLDEGGTHVETWRPSGQVVVKTTRNQHDQLAEMDITATSQGPRWFHYAMMNRFHPEPKIGEEMGQRLRISTLQPKGVFADDPFVYPLSMEIEIPGGIPLRSVLAMPDLDALLEYPGVKLTRDSQHSENVRHIMLRETIGGTQRSWFWDLTRKDSRHGWSLREGWMIGETREKIGGITRLTEHQVRFALKSPFVDLSVLHWYSK